MTDQNNSHKQISGGQGITAGGNINIGDINGQFAAGNHINQVQKISKADREELINKLIDFMEGIDKIELPEGDGNIARGEISIAVKEAKKDQPDISKIREKVKNSVDTIKEAGHIIEDISGLYEPAKKIAKIIGLAASVLI